MSKNLTIKKQSPNTTFLSNFKQTKTYEVTLMKELQIQTTLKFMYTKAIVHCHTISRVSQSSCSSFIQRAKHSRPSQHFYMLKIISNCLLSNQSVSYFLQNKQKFKNFRNLTVTPNHRNTNGHNNITSQEHKFISALSKQSLGQNIVTADSE